MKDMSEAGFKLRLATGLTNEERLKKYFNTRGWTVVHIPSNGDRGPCLCTPSGEVVTTDFLLIKGVRVIWVEAKSKTRSNFFGKTGKWQTGIDLEYWDAYNQIAKLTPFPVWIFFLHEDETLSELDRFYGATGKAPTGLWGATLDYLEKTWHHKSDRYGAGGMIYWELDRLNQRATLDEFREAIGEKAKGA